MQPSFQGPSAIAVIRAFHHQKKEEKKKPNNNNNNKKPTQHTHTAPVGVIARKQIKKSSQAAAKAPRATIRPTSPGGAAAGLPALPPGPRRRAPCAAPRGAGEGGTSGAERAQGSPPRPPPFASFKGWELRSRASAAAEPSSGWLPPFYAQKEKKKKSKKKPNFKKKSFCTTKEGGGGPLCTRVSVLGGN